MTGCEKCNPFHERVDIRIPEDLRKVLRAAKEAVSSGILRVVEEKRGPFSVPFERLRTEGPWDDFVDYTFACIGCGQEFVVSTETYHGSGGEWGPQT